MISSRRSQASDDNELLTQGALLQNGSRPSLKDCLLSAAQKPPHMGGIFLLLGGTDVTHFHLRVAQSSVRGDFMPSYWSHCGILIPDRESFKLYDVPLDPPDGFHNMPMTNGVRERDPFPLDDPIRFPNLALLWFPIRPHDSGSVIETLEMAIKRVKNERGILDLTALILPWLRYVWGSGDGTNPLVAGNGIPAAAFIEAVCAVSGLELTPGLATKASCPEAIWQAAKWWHAYYQNVTPPAKKGPKGKQKKAAAGASQPVGMYWLGQPSASIVVK